MKLQILLFSLYILILPKLGISDTSEDTRLINNAIKSGLDFIKKQVSSSEHCCEKGSDPRGITALIMLTLLKSGVPLDDPIVQKGLNYLYKNNPESTYGLSLFIMTLEAAYGKYPVKYKEGTASVPKAIHSAMEYAVKQLLARWNGGYWTYNSIGKEEGDLSNTQFAVLALKSASRCGIRLPKTLWYRFLVYLISLQEKAGPKVNIIGGKQEDGESIYICKTSSSCYQARGWGYQHDGGIRGSMVAAGLSCVLIARSELEGHSSFSDQLRQLTERAVEDGFAWLAFNFTVTTNPKEKEITGKNAKWHYYYLYGLERVGRLSGYDIIGTHDWYREGALYLVKNQEANGAWNSSLLDTCFALLFLSKATEPLKVTTNNHEYATTLCQQELPIKAQGEKNLAKDAEEKETQCNKDKGTLENLVNLYLRTPIEEKRKDILKVMDSRNVSFEDYKRAINDNGCFKNIKPGISTQDILINGKSIRCTIFIPPQYVSAQKLPMILLMHGSGGTGISQIDIWLEQASKKGILLVAPDLNMENGWKGTHDERILPVSILQNLLKEYKIDSNRVFLSGNSAGGHCTWDTASFYSNDFAGLITTAAGPRLQNFAYLLNLRALAIYAMVGEKDDTRLIRNLRWAVRDISRTNNNVIYKEIPKHKHSISIKDHTEDIIRFLDSRQRNLYPKKLEFYLSDIVYGRFYWLQVLGLKGDIWAPGKKLILDGQGGEDRAALSFITLSRSKVAFVNAEIKGSNQIDIKTKNVSKLRIYLSPEIVDISKPVIMYINGKKIYNGMTTFNLKENLEMIRETGDRNYVFFSCLEFEINQ